MLAATLAAAWMSASARAEAPGQAPPGGAIAVPGVAAETLAPFEPLRVDVTAMWEKKGYVDWSAREVVAVGRSLQIAPTVQAAAMAQRGAGVIALRNALAATAGLHIGINGDVAGLRNGQVVLEGFVKDFQVTRTYSRQVGLQTWFFAEARVPMFGIRGLAARFYDEQLAAHRRLIAGMKRATWVAPASPRADEDDLLLFDARGAGFSPSMFPLVVDQDGRVLLDMETVPKAQAVERGVCGYATSTWEFQKLQSATDVIPRYLAAADGGGRGNVDGLPAERILLAEATAQAPPASEPASQPSSQPAAARQPRRYTVRAQRATGKNSAILVIANEDALRMLDSARAAGLAGQGRVLVVVDAAGAGMEGRFRPSADNPLAALPPEP